MEQFGHLARVEHIVTGQARAGRPGGDGPRPNEALADIAADLAAAVVRSTEGSEAVWRRRQYSA